MKKKLFLLLALFLTIFFTTSIVQAASFSLIKSNFTIEGSIGGSLDVQSVENFSEGYSLNSSIPVTAGVNFLDSYALSEASYRNVNMSASDSDPLYVYGYETETWISAYAYATTTLDFRPDFNGLGSTIIFTLQQGQDPGHHSFAGLTLTDTTTSINILQISSAGPFYAVSQSPLGGVLPESIDWMEEGVWGVTTDSLGFGVIPFTFAAWDSSHEYQLCMITGTSDIGYPAEKGYAEITTEMVFSNVPEPATLLLVGLGLMAVLGIRRKMK